MSITENNILYFNEQAERFGIQKRNYRLIETIFLSIEEFKKSLQRKSIHGP